MCSIIGGMGWQNPPLPWAELERRLAGRPPPPGRPPEADGGDAPAWSSRRQPYRSPGERGPAGPGSGGRGSGGLVVPYAELHCHSNASFLHGGSHPEELAEEAARLRLEALAITDHDGMYGIVRFAEAARALGLPTVFGAELTLVPSSPGEGMARTGTPDPGGEHLVVLARGPEGYGRLCRAISEAQMAGAKGAPVGQLGRLAGLHGGHWVVLTGCRKGAVPGALHERGPAAAQAELDRLVQAFGRDNVYVEIWDHGDPLDSARN